jgi:hypothetical protein
VLKACFVVPVFAVALIGNPSRSPPFDIKSAESRAQIGKYYLTIGRLDDAKSNCDAAFTDDPQNEAAKTCLRDIALQRVEQAFDTAPVKLLGGDSQNALQLSHAAAQLASTLAAHPGFTDAEKQRLQKLCRRAWLLQITASFAALVPDWLRQALVVIAVVAVLTIFLIIIRWLWRLWLRRRWQFSAKTHWTLLPFREDPGPPTGTPTTYFLDALTRLPGLLARPPWTPQMLLLRPTPPQDHEPPIIDVSISHKYTPPIALLPEPHYARLDFEEHEIQLDDAVQMLQLKIAAGIDIGSVAKFMAAIVRWLKAGSPVISGTAATKTDGSVTIQIAATLRETQCLSVMANIAKAPGIDATQFAARRAAVKLVLRYNHREWTDNEVEGFTALRQAVLSFSQFAGTARGSGESVHTRASSLKQAASDFALFRASLPFHCTLSAASLNDRKENGKHVPSRSIISDEVRQADLLAEGIAHVLAGNQKDLEEAVICFRQLQDWPSSENTVHLRQQAAYNEAIVWRQMGSYRRTVLILTELLGEHPYFLDNPSEPQGTFSENSLLSRLTLAPHDPLRFPARLARLSAFGEYTVEDWTTLPERRIDFLMKDAVSFIPDFISEEENLISETENPLFEQQRHIRQYIYVEGLRAVGHAIVLRASRSEKRDDKQNASPGSNDELPFREELRDAIAWMKEAEQVLPSITLYCDLAQAHLLLREFDKAQVYARDAILQDTEPNEYAIYLAAKSYLEERTETSLALARKYADRCSNPTYPDLVALRKELESPGLPNSGHGVV